jgi:uncharacterized protein YkwD
VPPRRPRRTLVWRAAWLVAAGAGCGAPATTLPPPARVVPGGGGPATSGAAMTPEAPLRPARPGARVYASAPTAADRTGLAADPLRSAILDDARALARRARLPVPDPDPRLDLAMNDLARNLRGDDIPALEVVDFLLGHYGLAEPSPHLLLARASAGADPEVREHTAAEIAEVYKAGPVGRVGVGIDRDGDVLYVVVGLQEKHVELAPVPRRLAHGGATAIAGRVEGRYRDARLEITAPGGAVTEQDLVLRAGGFRGAVRCGEDGRYQVEITADDALGTAVLANFPVYCGVDAPELAPRAAGVKPGGVDAGAAEKQMLDLVNRDRQAARLPPVTLDPRLAAIARAHSHDMSEHDFVAHVSPRTGNAMDRVRRAGLSPELVLENVGRAYGPDEAESGFLTSPGHRGNIVDPRARRLGVGIVMGKPASGTVPMFVTQLFTN